MSIATLVLGESGSGKSTSLRNMDPAQTLLIQAISKPLPFKSKQWTRFDRETNKTGNVFVSDQTEDIAKLMQKTSRKVIVVDDYQYVMANEYMRRTSETGYTKFTEIAKHSWDIFKLASELPEDVRVYFLSHTQTDDQGAVRIKTIGKMLDEKITIEGMFTIVLKTVVTDTDYFFSTKNNGADTVKSPIGMFETERIANDLLAVDNAIKSYYEIN
jgi:predicted ATP-dependent serine protease